MKITQPQNNQIQTFGTDAGASAEEISSQKSQQPAPSEREKTKELKTVSKSEASSKKAELGMAGQAQAASLREKADQGVSVRWKADRWSGGLYPQLERGDHGPGVLAFQKALNERRKLEGKPPIKEDGAFGKETQKAVAEYQEDFINKEDGYLDHEKKGDKFTELDGKVGPETWRSMGAYPRLQYGCKGDAVREFQQALNEYRESKGLPRIKDDGKFGPETEKAVRQYQSDHKNEDLRVDGIVGGETLLSLREDLGVNESGKEHLDPGKEVESDPGKKVESRPEEPSVGDLTKLGGLSYDDVKETAGSLKKGAEKLAEYTNPFRLGEKVGEQVRPLVDEAKKAVEETDPFRPLGVDSDNSHKVE
jgi:peptidoglycan hydrolase-like protein with peptidoglycan-binding domain